MKQLLHLLWYIATLILILSFCLGWLAALLWGNPDGKAKEVQGPVNSYFQVKKAVVTMDLRYLGYQPCSFEPFITQLDPKESGMTGEDVETFSDWRFVPNSKAAVDGFAVTYGIALPPIGQDESYLVTLGRELISMSYVSDSQYGQYNSRYFPAGEQGDKGSPVGNAVLGVDYSPGTAYLYAVSNKQLEGFDYLFLNEPIIYRYKFTLSS